MVVAWFEAQYFLGLGFRTEIWSRYILNTSQGFYPLGCTLYGMLGLYLDRLDTNFPRLRTDSKKSYFFFIYLSFRASQVCNI